MTSRPGWPCAEMLIILAAPAMSAEDPFSGFFAEEPARGATSQQKTEAESRPEAAGSVALSKEEAELAREWLSKDDVAVKAEEELHAKEVDVDRDGSPEIFVTIPGRHGNAVGPYVVIQRQERGPRCIGRLGMHRSAGQESVMDPDEEGRPRIGIYHRLNDRSGHMVHYTFDLQAGRITETSRHRISVED